MNIYLMSQTGEELLEVSPSIRYECFSELLDFPENEYNSDTGPIVHEVKLVVSMDIVHEELENAEEQLMENYRIDKDSNHIILANLTMTEFPNTWREMMGVS